MPGRRPRACSSFTSQITSGVLPVPPTVMFPTTMTGAAARVAVSSPERCAQARAATTAPNTLDSARSASGGCDVAYQIACSVAARPDATCACSVTELEAVQLRVGTVLREQAGMLAVFDDAALSHHDDMVGVL